MESKSRKIRRSEGSRFYLLSEDNENRTFTKKSLTHTKKILKKKDKIKKEAEHRTEH